MIGPDYRDAWIGLICDTSSATVLAARGAGPNVRVIAQLGVELDAEDLERQGRLAGLEQFVAEHRLAGCPARVAFAGAGTLVQKLHMPPLSARNRNRAIQTRLNNYAAGRPLVIGIRAEEDSARDEGTHVLVAGVDRALARGVNRACRNAGLCVQWMTALADLFESPPGGATVVQLLLGERTTTIQLFDAGRLVGCRDVLLGRNDFVTAYQRPILTSSGPVTLSPADADALAREVGIPVGREDEVRPGLAAVQLWPMLTPVLQKLRREIEQSLAHSQLEDVQHPAIRVLGVPALPGLAEYLADDLQLQPISAPPAAAEADYLTAWSTPRRKTELMDLRPPEERLSARFTRPALAAGLCALLVILGNSAVPREAGAQLAALRPLAAQLQAGLFQAERDRGLALQTRDALAKQLQQQMKLAQALPRRIPVVALVQHVLDTVPPDVELLDVQVQAETGSAALTLRGVYQGPTAASVVAGHWARTLSEGGDFVSARVRAVSGSGRETPAFVELEALVK
jgi:hypothetical protein